MTYRVRWEKRALDELAEAWRRADSALRQAITTATHHIDQRLAQNPLGEGESRSGGRRVLLIAPLGVTYRLEVDGQTVSVLRVWLFRTPGRP